jgi:hypothetical protein
VRAFFVIKLYQMSFCFSPKYSGIRVAYRDFEYLFSVMFLVN